MIPYPYTDLSGTKKRPVIILTDADSFGNHIVAKITSVLRNDIFAFFLNDQDLSVSFYRPSEVRVNELFTVSSNLAIKSIAILSKPVTRQLLDQVITNFQ